MNRRRITGSALPISLLLALIIGVVSNHAIDIARLEASSTYAFLERSRLFIEAENGITQGLKYSSKHILPATGDSDVIAITALNDDLDLSVKIKAIAEDIDCIKSLDIRGHYIIESVVHSEAGGYRKHIQGFYTCNEACDEIDCNNDKRDIVKSYWTFTENNELHQGLQPNRTASRS